MLRKIDKYLREHKIINLMIITLCTLITIVIAIIVLGNLYFGKNIIINYEFYKANNDIIQSYIIETPENLLPTKLIIDEKDIDLLGQYKKYFGFDIIEIYSDYDLFHTYWHEIGHKVWVGLKSSQKKEYLEIYKKNAKSGKVEEDFANMFACYVSEIKPHLIRWNDDSKICEYYFSEDKNEFFKKLGVI